jgi:hypothetical protein
MATNSTATDQQHLPSPSATAARRSAPGRSRWRARLSWARADRRAEERRHINNENRPISTGTIAPVIGRPGARGERQQRRDLAATPNAGRLST